MTDSSVIGKPVELPKAQAATTARTCFGGVSARYATMYPTRIPAVYFSLQDKAAKAKMLKSINKI